MTLPPLLVLTDRTMCPAGLCRTLDAAVGHGARAVVLREKDLSEVDRARLIRDVRTIVAAVAGVLIVAGPAGDAVHLSSRDRMPDPRPALVGRSCHSPAETSAARTEGCDYMTVSPVFPSPSKPGYGPPLGLAGLSSLIGAAGGRPPLAYALGGVQPDQVSGCLAAGAHGVAVMGPVMRDPRVVADYLAAMAGRPA